VRRLPRRRVRLQGPLHGRARVIGGKGVEKIVEIPLTDEEKAMLKKSAKSVQAVVD
jgi:malate/lactate dehydrogenase